MLKTVDLSNWQAGIDIGSLGVEAVIAKATQGTFYVDPSCDRHYQLAKRLGKKLGVYHYASGGDPIAEADFFVNNIKGYLNEAILALDWEANQNSRFGEYASWCLPFLARVYQRTGIKPVLYMSASVVRAADWTSIVRNDYGLWVAGYPDNRNSWDIPGFPYNIAPWNFWAIWQYSSSGGTLDRDVFAGNAAAWDAYANAKPAATPAPHTDWVNMDTPRTMIAKVDIRKFDTNAKQIVGDVVLKAGESRPFKMKVTINGVTYLRTEYDTTNGNDLGISVNDLEEVPATPEPTPPAEPTEPEQPTDPSPPSDNPFGGSSDDNSNSDDDKEDPDMPTEPTTPTTDTETPNVPVPNHNRGLSDEEFAALQAASQMVVTEGWKPTVPDQVRLAVYLVASVGTPLITLVMSLLAIFGVIAAEQAIQVITVFGTFFGTIAGVFGISHFTRSNTK